MAQINLRYYLLIGKVCVLVLPVSYCVVFYFPAVQSSGYIPCFMFALWNSTTAVQHQFAVESSSKHSGSTDASYAIGSSILN